MQVRSRWRGVSFLLVAPLAAGFAAAAPVSASAHVTSVRAAHPVIRPITIHPRQAPHGPAAITRVRGSKPPAVALAGNVTYHGGATQKSPQVFVLFWGSWWASGCSDQQGNGSADETYLYNLYHGIGTTSDNESQVAAQYYGPAGSYPLYPVAGTTGVFGTWNTDCTDPPASATQAQLAAEADGYASSLAGEGYTITNNTQIVVVSPSGTNPGGGFGSQYCAWHSWTSYSTSQELSYTNLPYLPDVGSTCGANYLDGPEDGWSIVGGHEYNEAVTDPFGNGWYDSSYSGEVGDKCAWTGIFNEKLSTGTFAMQPEWDNHVSGCSDAFTFTHGRIKYKAKTTLCVQDSATAGTAATLYSPCDTNSARTFANFPDKSLRRWQNTGKCLQPTGNSTANGAKVVVEPCNEGKSQQWTWKSASSEWVNTASGKCLRAASATAGTALTQYTCSSTSASEKWTNV